MLWCYFSFSAAGQELQSRPGDQQPGVQSRSQPVFQPSQQETAIELQRRSIAIQQQSIERQRGPARPPAPVTPSRTNLPVEQASSSPPAESSPLPFDCAPVPPLLLQSIVQKAAAAYAVAPNLINAVIRQESAGYPCAVSDKGAMGLMQLMPATAVQMGAVEPFDVVQNVTAGTRLLSELMQRYKGDLNRVLGAYNAGPAAVDRAGGPPPFPETLNYIRSITEQIKQPLAPKLFAAPIR